MLRELQWQTGMNRLLSAQQPALLSEHEQMNALFMQVNHQFCSRCIGQC